MPDLEMLLRDVRPAPDPAWATKLDARVAARFPKPTPAWKKPLIAFREHFFAFGAVATVGCAILALVVVGIRYSNGSSDDSGSVAMTEQAPSSDSAGGGSTAKVPAPTLSPESRTFSNADRAVISSATLTLSTTPDKVNTVSDRAIRVVDGLGGYVQTSEVNSSGNSASAALTVEDPVGQARRRDRPAVQARARQGPLAAGPGRDRPARCTRGVRARRARRPCRTARSPEQGHDRCGAFAAAGPARSRVASRHPASARGERLGAAVSYATVELEIDGDRRGGAAAPPEGRWTPGDAVGDALRVLEVIAGVLVIALAVLIPVGLIALLGGLAGRIVVRHRRERALDIA